MRWIFRAVFLFAVIIGGFVLAERITVYPLDPRHVSPAEAGIAEMKELRVLGAHDRELIVWHAPARQGKPTIFYLHGNAGNLANRVPRFQRFLDRGFGIVAPAYRGSSGSKGWPYQAGISADIRQIYWDLAKGRLTGEKIRPVIYGESIGAAVAVQLNLSAMISADADLGAPKAIILEAPFTSLKDVAHAVQPELVLLTGLMLSRWESIEVAPLITAPLLILHGRNDPLIPIAHGRAIFEAAGGEDKEFYEVKDAGHIDVWKVAAQRKLFDWLKRF
jgi:fermentation-respiration switch protein FrsA (DUF1100 family)